MFSVLSGHLIIVPIMSLKRFLCAKYGSFLCVCVLALQRLLRCEFAVKVQSASWFQMHQLLSANPSLHGVTATALVFWGYICVCVCVCEHVTVGWRRAIVEATLASETERGGRWQQLRLHQRQFISLHVHIWTCLNSLHKHEIETCLSFVMCNLCFSHVSNVRGFFLLRLLAWEANREVTEKHARDRISIRHFFFRDSLKAGIHLLWSSGS